MKKQFLTLIAIVLYSSSFAQIRKKVSSKPTEIQQLRKSALSWFKDVYVESNFKDPYSYKLLKSSIVPISYSEGLSSMIDDAKRHFKNTDTADWGSDYKEKQREYLSSKRFHESRFNKIDSTNESYINSKKYLSYQMNNVNNELKKHLSYKHEIDSLMGIKVALSESKSKTIFYYIVYIDCYSNNSYGNPVLGRYSLYYDKNGLVRDPIQLNQD